MKGAQQIKHQRPPNLRTLQREYYMIEPQLFNPRKRRDPEPLSPRPSDSPPNHSKKAKLSHPRNGDLPPAFWDNLSTTYLTKSALQELDRRNTRAATIYPGHSRLRRPFTRRALAELRRSAQSSTSAIDYLCGCNARALKGIKQSARHGGPDLCDIRGLPMPPHPQDQSMSPSRYSSRATKQIASSMPNTKSSSRTTTTKSTGPYDRNFQQKLIDDGVYPDGYEYHDGRAPPPPSNLQEINERLTRPRTSLSPSKFTDESFRKFKRADTHAAKEKQVTTSVLPIIEGSIGDAKCVSGGIPFTNLDHLTDGTLVSGNPDIYYGARPEQLDRQVRDELSNQIIPSTQDDLPILPNFMVAVKGPDGSAAIAKRQANYDGALGARCMHALQSYRQESIYDKKAYTITSTYHDGQLKMYTSYPGESGGSKSRPEYYMYQLRSFAMADTAETFRQGATAYRNARDWATKQRNEAIKRANEKANEHRTETASAVPSPVQTSTSGATVENASSISQESREQRFESPSPAANSRDCRTPPSEVDLCAKTTKRSSEQVKQRSPLQRKRRNPDGAADKHFSQPELPALEATGLSQQFEEQILPQDSDGQSSEAEAQQVTSVSLS